MVGRRVFAAVPPGSTPGTGAPGAEPPSGRSRIRDRDRDRGSVPARGQAVPERAGALRQVPDPAVPVPVQVSALQALCRQVFGFRLAVLALASPMALVRVAPGPSSWIVGSAVVITFMGSYVLFRDWERFGPLLLRHPALLAVDTLFAAVLLAFATARSPLAYVTVCTPLLAGLVYGRCGAALFTAIQILVVAGAVSVDVRQHASVGNSLLLPGFCVVAGAAGVSLRRLILRFELATQALTRARARLAATEAVDAERARLAREMHDSVAKTLHGVTMAAEALAAGADRLDPPALRDQAAVVARAARRAAAESRELLGELRSGGVAAGDDRGDLTGPGFADELAARTAESAARTGLPATFERVGAAQLPGVPRPVARQLVSIVLEALENAHRHAGATRAEVAVGAERGMLLISVVDDGRGLPPGTTLQGLREAGHFGVVGMVERAAAIGARIRIGTGRSRGGTEVRLDLPVAALRTSPAQEAR